jgi:serine/threonine protein kinase
MLHRDVKTQNVLLTVAAAEHRIDLDMVMATKVADFGTVREYVREKRDESEATGVMNLMTHANTRVVIGTGPYMVCAISNNNRVREITTL